MKLTLDRLDLLPEHQNINCSLTRFEHFTPEAQGAIRAAGRATFYELDHSSYNAIHPVPLSGKVSLAEDCIVLELFQHDGQCSGGHVVRPLATDPPPLLSLAFAHKQTQAAAFLALLHAGSGIDITSPSYQAGLLRFIDAEESPE